MAWVVSVWLGFPSMFTLEWILTAHNISCAIIWFMFCTSTLSWTWTLWSMGCWANCCFSYVTWKFELCSVGKRRWTHRTFPMAWPKSLMEDFTNLYGIYKAHQTNVWWTMQVFHLHWLCAIFWCHILIIGRNSIKGNFCLLIMQCVYSKTWELQPLVPLVRTKLALWWLSYFKVVFLCLHYQRWKQWKLASWRLSGLHCHQWGQIWHYDDSQVSV